MWLVTITLDNTDLETSVSGNTRQKMLQQYKQLGNKKNKKQKTKHGSWQGLNRLGEADMRRSVCFPQGRKCHE